MMNQSTYELIFLKDTSFTKNNAYFIVDKRTQAAAIIDPACNLSQITDVILKRNIMLEQVLITHSHEDHVRRVCDLIALYNCDVYISRKEAGYYCPNLHYFEDEDILNKGISFPYIIYFARSVYGVRETKKYLFQLYIKHCLRNHIRKGRYQYDRIYFPRTRYTKKRNG